jgi:hypothetical protein
MTAENLQRTLDLIQSWDLSDEGKSALTYLAKSRFVEQRQEGKDAISLCARVPDLTVDHITAVIESCLPRKRPEDPPSWLGRDWDKGYNDTIDLLVGFSSQLFTLERKNLTSTKKSSKTSHRGKKKTCKNS